jgi:hypothetical protein
MRIAWTSCSRGYDTMLCFCLVHLLMVFGLASPGNDRLYDMMVRLTINTTIDHTI